MESIPSLQATLVIIILAIVQLTDGIFVCPNPCICTEESTAADGQIITQGPNLVIDCSKQALSKLPPLDGLQQTPIHRLLLDRNKITTLPSNAFQNLIVDGIQLSDNPLVNISADAFRGVKGLKYLSLRRTQLATLPNVFTSAIPSLEALDLSEIKTGLFDSIKSTAFGELPKLEQLLLKQNGIKSVMPDAFIGLPTVFELRLEDNKLPLVPEALSTLTELQYLHLDNNPIAKIDSGNFRTLSKLKSLTLSDTRLMNSSFIHPDAFDGLAESLNTLVLSINNLVTVPCETIGKLKHLKQLSLEDTMLKQIQPGCFKGLDNLQSLDLGGNNKIDFDKGIFNGIEDTLQSLFCGRLGLNLQNFPSKLFQKLEHLKELDLSGNNFPTVKEEAFSTLSVKELSLSYCNIEKVEVNAFKGLKSPSKLELNNNRIQNLTFLEDKCQFQNVELFRNPVRCDCDFYHVVRYGITSFKGKCEVPSQYSGIELNEFKSNSDVRTECGTMSGVDDEILCFWQLPQRYEDTGVNQGVDLRHLSSLTLVYLTVSSLFLFQSV